MAFMFQKQSAITHQSGTPINTDAVWVDFWPLSGDQPNQNLYTGGGDGNPAGLQRVVIPRHGGVNASAASQNFASSQKLPGAVNLSLADGHVETSPLEHLWSFYWNAQWSASINHIQAQGK
jgi:prepilin-type processing-associated H-X9-DG protein